MYSLLVIPLMVCLLIVFLNRTVWWMRLRYQEEIWTDCDSIVQKHKSNTKVVLLIHEFSGSPDSLRELGENLFSAGWDIVIPSMPGATKSVQVLEKNAPSLYHQWVGVALKELESLKPRYRKVALVGASLGGSIALELGVARPGLVSAIVTLASPVRLTGDHYRRKWLRNTMIRWSGVLSLFIKTTVTGILKPQGRKLVPLHGIEGLLVLPAVHSHKVGLRKLVGKLNKVKAPLLVMHVRDDRTVSVRNQELICNRAGAEVLIKKTFTMKQDLTRHHHIWSHKKVKERVSNDIKHFLSR